MKRTLVAFIIFLASLLIAGYFLYPFLFGPYQAPEGLVKEAPYPEKPVAAPTDTTQMKAAVMGSQLASTQLAPRNVTISVYMKLQVSDESSAYIRLSQIASQYGGYVQSSSLYEGGGYVTLKVPADRIESALKEIRAIGKVEREEKNVEDVTEQVLDVDTRLKNLKATEERLLELLSKAEKMEDILAIEDKLSQVRQQIEWLEAMRRNLKLMIDYATISVELRKMGYTPPEEDPLSRIWEDARKAFLGSLYLLVVASAFLALPLALAALAYGAYRLRRSRSVSSKESP